MIALPQRLPHIIWKNDRLVPLSEGWLAESIEHAAEAAGHHRWHLAPEGARAIAVYLENDWVAPALKVDHLREMVQRSLEGIGYEDIARESLIVPPRVSISLMEIAVRAPYEIEFYPLLKERLADALEVQVGGLRLEGLRSCAKVLDAAGRWRSTCVRISDDIIYFCRSYIYRTKPRMVDLVIQ
jgi:ubiquinone biosynthesis protein COQ9